MGNLYQFPNDEKDKTNIFANSEGNYFALKCNLFRLFPNIHTKQNKLWPQINFNLDHVYSQDLNFIVKLAKYKNGKNHIIFFQISPK